MSPSLMGYVPRGAFGWFLGAPLDHVLAVHDGKGPGAAHVRLLEMAERFISAHERGARHWDPPDETGSKDSGRIKAPTMLGSFL